MQGFELKDHQVYWNLILYTRLIKTYLKKAFLPVSKTAATCRYVQQIPMFCIETYPIEHISQFWTTNLLISKKEIWNDLNFMIQILIEIFEKELVAPTEILSKEWVGQAVSDNCRNRTT